MNCKYCAHRRTCETSLHDDDYCADYRTSCPLPRIGSKEWGWEWDAKQQMYTSPKTSIGIQSSFGNTRIFRYYDVIIGLDGVPLRIGANLILRDAKILAEARARRDWRKEQGKK